MTGENVKVSIQDLNFYYGTFQALKDITVPLYDRKVTAFIGPSGCGKSTLLRVFNRIYELYPKQTAEGQVLLDGQNVLDRSQDLNLLRTKIGMVFQGFNLAGRTTVLNNVLVGRLTHTPYWRTLMGAYRDFDRQIAFEALDRVGILSKVWDRASALSGGQQQRVAIARALLNSPTILLADEPTGNLDSKTSLEVMDLFQRLQNERGITIVLITHEVQVAEYGTRIIRFKDGRIVADRPNTARRGIDDAALESDDEIEAAAR